MQKFNARNATPKELHTHVFNVVSEVSGITVEELDYNLSIADDIAPNSIDRITLYMALEDEFGQSIPENEVRDITTLGDLLEFIEKRIQAL